MKILIAADMEGITGVVDSDQTNPSHAEYNRFRRLMTGDVNAAIRGAFDAGADEVVVSDGHWFNLNILIEELDPTPGSTPAPRGPFSMVEGVQYGVDGVRFVGYHARVGTQDAILDHTWSSGRVDGVWLNGEIVGEIGLNAAVCGHFGVPVLMISGDQTVLHRGSGAAGRHRNRDRQARHRPQLRRVSAAGGHDPIDPGCGRTRRAAVGIRRRPRAPTPFTADHRRGGVHPLRKWPMPRPSSREQSGWGANVSCSRQKTCRLRTAPSGRWWAGEHLTAEVALTSSLAACAAEGSSGLILEFYRGGR